MRQEKGAALSPYTRLPLAPRIPAQLHCGATIAMVEQLKTIIRCDPVPQQQWNQQIEAATKLILEGNRVGSEKRVEDACLIAWLLHPPVTRCNQVGTGSGYFRSFLTGLRQMLDNNTLSSKDGGTENKAAKKAWKILIRFYQDVVEGHSECLRLQSLGY